MAQQPDLGTDTSGSERLHRDGLDVFPGGVSHNVRYADPYPIYIESSEGPFVRDVDGNEYVDLWNDHGASLLGHAPPSVVEAVQAQAEEGLHFGAANEPALELGRRVIDWVPSAERMRYCVTGTEATMYAVRLARAHTGRSRILKVEGGWHGGNTDLSVAVHAPFDAPTSNGLPPGAADHCHAFELNDRDSVAELFEAYRGEIAAAIVDPRQAGTEPANDFLEFLVDTCEDDGALFIFDEVVTGFRVAPGMYQSRVGITPDLTTMGKIVGGGMPVGALAGRADLFEPARPDNDTSPSDRVLAGGGTFSTDPLTAAAGLATLDVIENEPVYDHTEALGEHLRDGLDAAFEEAGVNGQTLGFSSLIQPVFNADRALNSPTDVKEATDGAAVAEYHRRLLDHGYYFNRGSMGNVSYAMTEAQVDGLIEATRTVVSEMKADGYL